MWVFHTPARLCFPSVLSTEWFPVGELSLLGLRRIFLYEIFDNFFFSIFSPPLSWIESSVVQLWELIGGTSNFISFLLCFPPLLFVLLCGIIFSTLFFMYEFTVLAILIFYFKLRFLL